MWDDIKRAFNVFYTPSPMEIAARELVQAQRSLLEAQSAREYADAMVTYHTKRIDRLQRYLREENQ